MHYSSLLIALLTLPQFVSAQAPGNFRELVNLLVGLLTSLIPLIIILTMIVFFWGITKAWIIGAGDPKAIEDGRKIAVAGIIAFVVITGVWGIVAILRRTFFGF